MTKHFINLDDLPAEQLSSVVKLGIELKHRWLAGEINTMLHGKTVALLFSMPSTRTRLSFEAGVLQLGGFAFYIDATTTQLARSEPIADTAKVFGGMCDAVVIRHRKHEEVVEFANHCEKTVVNALTRKSHPCQVLADVMTFEELRGSIAGKKIAWIGDCNNVCYSWLQAAQIFDFEFNMAAPKGFDQIEIPADTKASVGNDPMQAVADADCVVTDVWFSMGDNLDSKQAFTGFTVDNKMMSKAKSDAIFMHCLPAHRGEEVAAEVIDGPASVVWQEANNRLHVQKALLLNLLNEQ